LEGQGKRGNVASTSGSEKKIERALVRSSPGLPSAKSVVSNLWADIFKKSRGRVSPKPIADATLDSIPKDDLRFFFQSLAVCSGNRYIAHFGFVLRLRATSSPARFVS